MMKLLIPALLCGLLLSSAVSATKGGQAANSRCLKEPDSGPCRAFIPKYAYYKNTNRCQMLIYGGCGNRENANLFDTLEECEEACVEPKFPSEEPNCNLPADTGFCRASIPSFFYNIRTGECEVFTYGGCNGNANRFSSREECEGTCKNVCLLPRKVGPCRAAFSRYFFSQETGRCEWFIYGGCEGNANNFPSPEECERRCSP